MHIHFCKFEVKFEQITKIYLFCRQLDKQTKIQVLPQVSEVDWFVYFRL